MKQFILTVALQTNSGKQAVRYYKSCHCNCM